MVCICVVTAARARTDEIVGLFDGRQERFGEGPMVVVIGISLRARRRKSPRHERLNIAQGFDVALLERRRQDSGIGAASAKTSRIASRDDLVPPARYLIREPSRKRRAIDRLQAKWESRRLTPSTAATFGSEFKRSPARGATQRHFGVVRRRELSCASHHQQRDGTPPIRVAAWAVAATRCLRPPPIFYP